MFFIISFFTSNNLKADPMKEFILSCTYGTLAGTLVGFGTLAFTRKPSEHLGNIARGASLGLYSGIILGLYVVYGVPDSGENINNEEPPPQLPPNFLYNPDNNFKNNFNLDINYKDKRISKINFPIGFNFIRNQYIASIDGIRFNFNFSF